MTRVADRADVADSITARSLPRADQSAVRAAFGWRSYQKEANATAADISVDWHQLLQIRRDDFRDLIARLPSSRLRPGLTPASAADTGWPIASPQSYDPLFDHGSLNLDRLESWVAATLIAALLPDG